MMADSFSSFFKERSKVIQQQHFSYLEMMAAAFLKQTNIPPDEAELVEWIDAQGTYHFHFQKRLEAIKELKT